MDLNDQGPSLIKKFSFSLKTDGSATFLKRQNRFLSIIEVEGHKELAHVHDPGRLKELLFPGNRVLYQHKNGALRKTSHEIIAAARDGNWIPVNSSFHNSLAEVFLKSGAIKGIEKSSQLKREKTCGKSRLDFFIAGTEKHETWIEIKGCSLYIDKTALFPDAPTLRGTRHLRELAQLAKKGNRAMVIFLVFGRGVTHFSPKSDTDPEFAAALRHALKSGVEIYAPNFLYDGSDITFNKFIFLRGI